MKAVLAQSRETRSLVPIRLTRQEGPVSPLERSILELSASIRDPARRCALLGCHDLDDIYLEPDNDED